MSTTTSNNNMRRYTFWHGSKSSNNSSGNARDMNFLEQAVESLQQNTWTSPLYVDGAGWQSQEQAPATPSQADGDMASSATTVQQEAALKLFQALGSNTSATNLILQNAQMNPELHQALAQALDQNSTLASVTLRNLTASGEQQEAAAYQLPASVFNSEHIATLNLTKTTLTEAACDSLSAMMVRQHLTTLTLNDVQMTHPQAFFQALAKTTSLTTLKITNKGTTTWSPHTSSLLQALTVNTSITTLHLEGLELNTDDHATLLANLLQHNQTVTQLSLRQNALTALALPILVQQGLLHNTTLQTLFLSRNPLGEATDSSVATKALSQLLQQGTTLQTLCLVSCQFHKEQDCQAIVQALRQNQGLQSISLDGNDGVTMVVAQTLVQVLQQDNLDLTHILDQLPSILSRGRRRQTAAFPAWNQVDFWLRANQAQRRQVWNQEAAQEHVLPQVLANVGPSQQDVLFCFLRNSPQLFRSSES